MDTHENHNETRSTERPGSFLQQMAEKIGVSANAATVYGTPVERGGVTVVPVARARWGFGGGGGRSQKDGQAGSGGGGGVIVSPVGYIEVKDGETRFRPIYNPVALGGGLMVGSIMLLLILKALRGLAAARR